jgi:hypothetical protein
MSESGGVLPHEQPQLPTKLNCQWCQQLSEHDPLEEGMQALICYCSHDANCQFPDKRQFQCLCRDRPWEFKNQITRRHARPLCHRVEPALIQKCQCPSCFTKGQGRSRKRDTLDKRHRCGSDALAASAERPAKKPQLGIDSPLLEGFSLFKLFSQPASIVTPLTPAQRSSLRASLLQEAPRLIDQLLDAVPAATVPPHACQVGDHRVTLVPAADPSLVLPQETDVLSCLAGAKLSLISATGELLVDPTITICWQDTVFRFEEPYYVIPPLPLGEVHPVCVSSHPRRYFCLRVKPTPPEVGRLHPGTADADCPLTATHCIHDGCADLLQTSLDNFWIAKSYERSKHGRILHLQEHYGASIQTTPRNNDHLCNHCFSNYWEGVLGTHDFDCLDNDFASISEPDALEALPLNNTTTHPAKP